MTPNHSRINQMDDQSRDGLLAKMERRLEQDRERHPLSGTVVIEQADLRALIALTTPEQLSPLSDGLLAVALWDGLQEQGYVTGDGTWLACGKLQFMLAMSALSRPSPDIIGEIEKLVSADPFGGGLAQATVEAIAGLVFRSSGDGFGADPALAVPAKPASGLDASRCDQGERSLKLWSVPVRGFDDQTAVATTAAKAKAAVYRAGREAGYFGGGGGFRQFLTHVGFVQEIHWREVERRIGCYRPAGAPDGWSLEQHKAAIVDTRPQDGDGTAPLAGSAVPERQSPNLSHLSIQEGTNNGK